MKYYSAFLIRRIWRRMEFKDFKIGEVFYTGPEADLVWMVTDIGTKFVIAYKVEESTKNEPADLQNNEVFYEYDFGGCTSLFSKSIAKGMADIEAGRTIANADAKDIIRGLKSMWKKN
jgi:hypothetical protein